MLLFRSGDHRQTKRPRGSGGGVWRGAHGSVSRTAVPSPRQLCVGADLDADLLRRKPSGRVVQSTLTRNCFVRLFWRLPLTRRQFVPRWDADFLPTFSHGRFRGLAFQALVSVWGLLPSISSRVSAADQVSLHQGVPNPTFPDKKTPWNTVPG